MRYKLTITGRTSVFCFRSNNLRSIRRHARLMLVSGFVVACLDTLTGSAVQVG